MHPVPASFISAVVSFERFINLNIVSILFSQKCKLKVVSVLFHVLHHNAVMLSISVLLLYIHNHIPLYCYEQVLLLANICNLAGNGLIVNNSNNEVVYYCISHR